MNFILKWLLGKIMDCFGGIFQLFAALSSDVFNQSVVITIFSFFKTIGLPLIGLAMMCMLFKVLLDHADGNGIQISDIVKRFVGGVIIYMYGVKIMQGLYVALLGVTGKMISVIANVSTDGMDVDWSDVVFGHMSVLLTVILTALCIFYMLKSFIDVVERTWQYIVILCMMYIYVLGYIIGNDEAIISWFKQFSQFFQIILVTLGMCLFVQCGTIQDFLFAIGAIIAASKVEQLLDRYGMGSGGKIANAMRNAMSVGFYGANILKSMK